MKTSYIKKKKPDDLNGKIHWHRSTIDANHEEYASWEAEKEAYQECEKDVVSNMVTESFQAPLQAKLTRLFEGIMLSCCRINMVLKLNCYSLYAVKFRLCFHIAILY